ncbi:MAG: polysaccharide deacetylase family protein [Syntrophomonas sp.]
MLTIHVPNTYIPERSYIIRILLHEFLGLDINLRIEKRSDILIKMNNDQAGRTLRIADVLFQTPTSQWLTMGSLPNQPLRIWTPPNIFGDVLLISFRIPIIYGVEPKDDNLCNGYLTENGQELYMGLDIFGSAFFMLTRYEEYVKPDRDRYDCFPASASLSYQEGFLDRPIINEYLEILWWCLTYLWPGIKRKNRYFRMIVTHDVDVPFAQAFSGVQKLIRNCGGDLLIRKSAKNAFNRLISWQAVKRGKYRKDVNYTFDGLMDISEKNSIRSAFYFKTACTNTIYDDIYSIDHKYMRQLLRDIHGRGHEIGLHPSYETYKNPAQTKAEFKKLLEVCDEEGIHQNHWGGRQHYLRWQVPITWRNWAAAGLDYDSTLGFNEYYGFRCGICYEFPVFDLEKHNTIQLTERPLIVMEESVFEQRHIMFNYSKAFEAMNEMKKCCQRYSGDFTILWHNSSLYNDELWELYKSIIS